MAITCILSSSSISFYNTIRNHSFCSCQSSSISSLFSTPNLVISTGVMYSPILRCRQTIDSYSAAAGGGGNGGGGSRSGGGGGDGDDGAADKNRDGAMLALANMARSLESCPKDLADAIQAGRIPGSVVVKYFELEKSSLLNWMCQFGGIKERLLADDLFLAKAAMECGFGMFTKTAAEYARRKEKFFNELEIVFADVVMAVIADFMLVYLPAPTISLRPPPALGAGFITKFFHGCPDNAFQVSLSGSSYSFLQRIGAIVSNGTKLFAVGATSSLVGTVVTNALIDTRKAVDKSQEQGGGELEKVPVLSTSLGYGVYMGVSSNLRYQIVAGVVEQRFLEPILRNHRVILSAICFAVRTGNTYLGSLLWVDYARWIGVQ